MGVYRRKISISRKESLALLKALALFSAAVYEDLLKIEDYIDKSKLSGQVKMLELKKIDLAGLLLTVSSVERRLVEACAKKSFVMLGIRECKILFGALEKDPKKARPELIKKLKDFCKEVREHEKLERNDSDMKVVYAS